MSLGSVVARAGFKLLKEADHPGAAEALSQCV